MSKWSDNFIEQYKNTRKIREITKQIEKNEEKEISQKKMDQIISEILNGKWKRRGY